MAFWGTLCYPKKGGNKLALIVLAAAQAALAWFFTACALWNMYKAAQPVKARIMAAITIAHLFGWRALFVRNFWVAALRR